MLEMVPKPWGYELIWARTDQYVAKLIFINGGHRLSLQRHHKKMESFYVLEGMAEGWEVVSAGFTKRWRMKPGESLTIPPGTSHRLGAPLGTVRVMEVATASGDDDIERLEDDYGRATS